jgi:nicotinate-nucleotide adenylyltransferase
MKKNQIGGSEDLNRRMEHKVGGQMKGKWIGILGGTFNPVHLGHLILAETARIQFKLDQILFMPNYIPPHRSTGDEILAPSEDRYNMLLLAAISNLNFEVSSLELDKEELSYTFYTVEELTKLNPKNRYFFICGADALLLHDWYRFSELAEKLEGFLLAPRQGEGIEKVKEKMINRGFLAVRKIKKIDMIPIGISSTLIRTRIRERQPIRYLVPELVETYIYRKKLYLR